MNRTLYEPQALEEMWDARWNKRRERGWQRKSGTKMMDAIDAQARSGELPPGAHILDLGCGYGRHMFILLDRGYRVTGIDISSKALDEVRARLRDGQDARLIQAETRNLGDVEDESMHLALSWGTFHHNTWLGIEDSFAEVARVLKPGKHFLLGARSIGDTKVARKEVADHGYAARDDGGGKGGVLQHYFSEEELLGLGRAHGFEIAAGPIQYVPKRKHDPRTGRGRLRWFVDYRKTGPIARSTP